MLEQEPGSSGKKDADYFVRSVLAGYPARAVPTSRNKILNARPFAGQQQAGNVRLVRKLREDGSYGRADWWEMFTAEAASFPRGAHDDMVDAASQAYNDLAGRAMRRSRARIGGAAGRMLYRERLYTLPELVRLLGQHGFETRHAWGGTAGRWGRRTDAGMVETH